MDFEVISTHFVVNYKLTKPFQYLIFTVVF